ncbi:MAG: flagellar export chaperone FliS [Actinomycetota bacterium]|nr:flagellar export chaperone FliS [Actinomycetota bacterium]
MSGYGAGAMRSRYVQDSVTTASPARLLVMLYDRLVLDLQRGEAAQRAGLREEANEALLHAQEILLELQMTLDTATWEGAPGLAALYSYLHAELVGANTTGDADRTAACRQLVDPLLDAWRQAAASLPQQTSAQQPSTSA